ncbi:MAG: hypothetical protein AAGF30_15185 [Pseudomonadota bacterium]
MRPADVVAPPDPKDPYAREGQIFPKLEEEQIARLSDYGRAETLADGTMLFTRGQRGVDFSS